MKNNTPKYDIFISYRRSSFESANMIATALKARGYRVFFDVENLRSGKFNEQLFDVIDRCTDFLLILPENALDRCNDPEDWVRKEVMRAMQGKKNIVPVMLSGFSWPENMPEGLDGLQFFQSLTASSREYFDLAMTRLAKSYLKSRPHRNKVLNALMIALAGLVVLACVAYGILRIASFPLANKIGTEVLGHMVTVDGIAQQYSGVYSAWDTFCAEISSSESLDVILSKTEDMLVKIQSAEAFMQNNIPEDSTAREFSTFQSAALSSRGLKTQDIAAEPAFVHQLVLGCLQDIQSLRRMIEEPDMGGVSLELASLRREVTLHSLYGYQYSVAEIVSDMPGESRENFLLACRDMKVLPCDIPLTLTRTEYVSREEAEMNKSAKATSDMETVIEKGKTVSEELAAKENGVNELFEAVNTIIEAQRQSDAVISTKKTAIEAKRTAVSARKAELEKVETELAEAYDDLVEKCTIEESDGKGYMWGKICKMAAFLEDMVATEKDCRSKGVNPASSLTPDVVYANLASMLNSFKAYHPESAQLAESAKIFYREVSKGKRELKGVVVSEFKEGTRHSFLKMGDIILTMKGVEVASYDELLTAFKKDGNPAITYLHLEDGKLVERSSRNIGDTSNVGFNDLKESD